MRTVFGRAKPLDLDRKLDAVRKVVDLADGRMPPEDVAAARSVARRAGERLRLGSEATVVALAGATGSGKSSLFNALSGEDLSAVGVRRPTTGTAHASVWGDVAADELLDWLGVPHRHRISGGDLDGLVLLDLPDHDSTQVDHRMEVNRLIELVDVFVWVVDPQKYADAALHEGYLRPLSKHARVTMVVLNHADRLTDGERRQIGTDLRRLLEADGLRDVRVVATSARTGDGIDTIRDVLRERVAAKRAAAERLASDVEAAAGLFGDACTGEPRRRGIERKQRDRLVAAFSSAAGVDDVAEAVAASHRRSAALTTGWPLTRWLRRVRPDPLARLHLGKGSSGGRTSLTPPTAIERAQVEIAVRTVAEEASEGLSDIWRRVMRARVADSTGDIVDRLDRAVAETELHDDDRPVWWTVASALQTALLIVATLGFLWLTVLFVLEWLQIPRPPTPEVQEFPWPTLLLVGGLASGALLALVARALAAIGGARRRRRTFVALREQVGHVAHETVVAPLEEELQARRDLCAAVGEAFR